MYCYIFSQRRLQIPAFFFSQAVKSRAQRLKLQWQESAVSCELNAQTLLTSPSIRFVSPSHDKQRYKWVTVNSCFPFQVKRWRTEFQFPFPKTLWQMLELSVTHCLQPVLFESNKGVIPQLPVCVVCVSGFKAFQIFRCFLRQIHPTHYFWDLTGFMFSFRRRW